MGYTLIIICRMNLNLPRRIYILLGMAKKSFNYWNLLMEGWSHPIITNLQLQGLVWLLPWWNIFATKMFIFHQEIMGLSVWSVQAIWTSHHFPFQKDENTTIQFTFKSGLHIIYILLCMMQCKLLNSLLYSQLKLNQIIWLQQESHRFRNWIDLFKSEHSTVSQHITRKF